MCAVHPYSSLGDFLRSVNFTSLPTTSEHTATNRTQLFRNSDNEVMVMSLPNLGWILDAGARLNLSEDVGLKGWHFEDPPKYIRQFEFECYDHDYWVDVCMQYWKLPFYVGAVYLLTIYVLQRYMRNKAPLNLKTPLFLWNLGLGLFSIVGFCRILPAHVDVLLRQEGFYKRICVRYLTWLWLAPVVTLEVDFAGRELTVPLRSGTSLLGCRNMWSWETRFF